MNAMSGSGPKLLAVPQELAIEANDYGHINAALFSAMEFELLGIWSEGRRQVEAKLAKYRLCCMIFVLPRAVKLWWAWSARLMAASQAVAQSV